MDIVQKSNSNCDYFPPSSVSYRSYLRFFIGRYAMFVLLKRNIKNGTSLYCTNVMISVKIMGMTEQRPSVSMILDMRNYML
jgi:hypothetical protein